MSQETIDLYRESLDTFNRRDRAAFLALCHPEYENVPPRDWPESAPIRGREAVWDFFISNMDPWEEASFDVGEVIDVGNETVVAEQRAEVRGVSSGVQIAWSYWHVITFCERRALRSRWFSSRAEALASSAAG